MSICRAIFITATGTDAGKTYVSALLVRALREAGYHAGYYKPALSGAEVVSRPGASPVLIPGDCKFVTDTAAMEEAPESLTSYIFAEAVSPHLAARREKRKIQPDVILDDFQRMARQYDYLVVEGCGGIVCPLTLEQETLLLTDIMKMLALPVLIVSPSGLGAINSAVLTAAYARQEEISVRGFVMNLFDPSDSMHQDNRTSIQRLTGFPVVAALAENSAALGLPADRLLSLFQEVSV